MIFGSEEGHSLSAERRSTHRTRSPIDWNPWADNKPQRVSVRSVAHLSCSKTEALAGTGVVRGWLLTGHAADVARGVVISTH